MCRTWILATALAAAPLTASMALAEPRIPGPDRAMVLLGSKHLGADRSFEEVNPGLILLWEQVAWRGRLDVGLGGFRNSYGGASAVASLGLPFYRTQKADAVLFGALAWYPGYADEIRYTFADVAPLFGAHFRYENVFIQAVPAFGAGADVIMSFGLTFELD